MCCCPSACPTPSPMVLSGSLWGLTTPRKRWTYILKEVPAVVAYLREMSPVWDKEAQKPTWEL